MRIACSIGLRLSRPATTDGFAELIGFENERASESESEAIMAPPPEPDEVVVTGDEAGRTKLAALPAYESLTAAAADNCELNSDAQNRESAIRIQ